MPWRLVDHDIPAKNGAVANGPLPDGRPSAADLKAGLIVFFVALPLCLGIATASGAPPISGLIAGMVGGMVVALTSKSSLSVAGPAAGLTVIVLDAVTRLGLPGLLTATIIAGAIQVALGTFKLGGVAQLVPNAVIRGMLAGIGLILVLKQIPHAVGYDADYEGDFAFGQMDGHNTFSEIGYAFGALNMGAIMAAIAAALAMLVWRDYGKLKLRSYLPRELSAVLAGLGCSFGLSGTGYELASEHLVSIPLLSEAGGLKSLWTPPDVGMLKRLDVWQTGLTLAIVASIESLLSVEATDRLDPYKRITPPNRELIAQGFGNMTSGALGGLPVTAVVVRSFANVNAGGRTRWSSVSHGVMLIGATLFLAQWLNYIPLSALAVVLIVVGYKLTAPKLYKQTYAMGREQFIPFVVTVLCILFTDLLTGVLLGAAFSVFFVVYREYASAIVVTDDGTNRLVRFVASASFLHKAKLKSAFETAPKGGHVILDLTRARSVDADIMDTIRDFESNAETLGISLTIQRSASAFHNQFREGSA